MQFCNKIKAKGIYIPVRTVHVIKVRKPRMHCMHIMYGMCVCVVFTFTLHVRTCMYVCYTQHCMSFSMCCFHIEELTVEICVTIHT